MALNDPTSPFVTMLQLHPHIKEGKVKTVCQNYLERSLNMPVIPSLTREHKAKAFLLKWTHLPLFYLKFATKYSLSKSYFSVLKA